MYICQFDYKAIQLQNPPNQNLAKPEFGHFIDFTSLI